MPESNVRPKALAEILVENSVDGLAAIDRDYRYTLWNRAMEAFAGKRADEVLGNRVFDVFPFLRDRGLDVAMAQALAGETVMARAVPDVRPDGTRHYHDRHYSPLRDDSGTIIGMLAVVRDVTAQRIAEDALHESQEKLRMAVDAAGIGVWTWDLRTDEVVWQAPLCAIFGVPAGSAPVGRTGYLALGHPEDRARVEVTLAEGVKAGNWEDEHRIVRADGAVRWIMGKGTIVHREGHDLVVGSVIDVTERRQRDDRLRKAQKLEAVGQLTAGIAHNFNNILMGVLPNLELAARTADGELAPLLKSAERSAQRAADLVRQLMTYAGRNRPAERSVTSIVALVERIVAFCRTTFDQRIAFDERYESGARACVDPAQIEQALLNVLINARDAVGAGVDAPRLSVSVDVVRAGAPELEGRAGAFVRMCVGDNGVGMDTATVSRIYEPFFTTKDVGKGTGLGLATTHAIVREHGGWIACDSTLGTGTTFSLYFASAEALAVDHDTREEREPASARGTETVLVVDDEAPIRRVVSLMLSSAGFKAKVAASGQEALDLLADRHEAADVALILLDVSMPGMPWRTLRSRLRDVAPHARVVYFTGYAFEADGADDAVLEKPVMADRLLGTIREVLDREPVRQAADAATRYRN